MKKCNKSHNQFYPREKVAVELLVLLLRILKFSGLNPGTETGSPDRSVRGSPQSLQVNTWTAGYTKLDHDNFLLSPFQFIIHSPMIISSYIYQRG
jgi:hypothetical protein